MAGVEAEGHRWCECPALRQREQSFGPAPLPAWCPVTVGDVFLADVLDRAARAGSITQQSWWPRHCCLLRCNGGGMREVTEWDRAVSSWIQSAALLLTVCPPHGGGPISPPAPPESTRSDGSWFHISDNKTSLHKCLAETYISVFFGTKRIEFLSIWLPWDT